MIGVWILLFIIVLLLGRIAQNQVSAAHAARDNAKAIMESIAYWGKKVVDARSK